MLPKEKRSLRKGNVQEIVRVKQNPQPRGWKLLWGDQVCLFSYSLTSAGRKQLSGDEESNQGSVAEEDDSNQPDGELDEEDTFERGEEDEQEGYDDDGYDSKTEPGLTARQRAIRHTATTGERKPLFEYGVDNNLKRQVFLPASPAYNNRLALTKQGNDKWWLKGGKKSYKNKWKKNDSKLSNNSWTLVRKHLHYCLPQNLPKWEDSPQTQQIAKQQMYLVQLVEERANQ